VDIIAPGVCIKSTWNDGGYNCSRGRPSDYSDGNGHGTHVLSSGTTDWDNSDDPDGIKEPLLNVSNYWARYPPHRACRSNNARSLERALFVRRHIKAANG